MQAVIKLARSATSTQGAVARGTPEGKALQFAIRTTFLFAAINPIPGTAADASRLLTLELQPHEGNLESIFHKKPNVYHSDNEASLHARTGKKCRKIGSRTLWAGSQPLLRLSQAA